MSVRLGLALCLVLASPALAQPQPQPRAPVDADFQKELDALFVPGGMTADQAAARAPKVSPEVARRVADLDATIAQVQAAKTALVPQLTAKAGYTRLSFIAPVIFPGAMGMNFQIPFLQNSYLAEGQVALPLSEYVWRFPKLIDAAKAGADAARANKLASEVNSAQDARLAYYEWVRARLQALVAKHQLENARSVLKQEKALFDAQRVSKADLMRIESNAAEAEREQNQLDYLAQLREEQLRILIGAPDTEQITMSDAERGDISAPTPKPLEELINFATAHRLEFKAIDLGIKANEAQRESAKANYGPHLSAYAIADYANPNPRIFPQQDKFDFTWQAGVQLQWTINDALLEISNQKRLRAQTNGLRADRESLVRGTRIEVLAAQQGVETAKLSIMTTATGLAAAEESYRVRRELLTADRATAIEIIDAETNLASARAAAINARINLRVAIIQLVHVLGEDIPTAH